MSITQAHHKALASLFISLSLGLLTMQVQAETNTQFGRLFSKPNERSNLNVIRQNQKLKTISNQEAQQPTVVTPVEPAELPDPITLQGYVKRNDGGGNTLWINGQPVQENSRVDSVKVGKLNEHGFSKKGASTEGVDIKIPANGRHVRLKAGQMYAPEDNKVYEMQVVEKAKRLNLERSGTVSDGDNSSTNLSDNKQQ